MRKAKDSFIIDGSIVHTARREAQVEWKSDRVLFHLIQPKYCRMLGIDPESMLATSKPRVWVPILLKSIEREFADLSSESNLAERIWQAHVAAYHGLTADSLMEFVRKHFLGLPPRPAKSVPRSKYKLSEFFPSEKRQSPAVARRTNDAKLRKLATKPNSREALKWLAEASAESARLLGLCGTTAKSLKLVKKLYALGARKVVAADVKHHDWGEDSGILILTLPRDSKLRAKLFREEARWARAGGFDKPKDLKQTFMLLKLD